MDSGITLAKLRALSFGLSPLDLESAKGASLDDWLERQCRPPAGDEPGVAEMLRRATLTIEYGPGEEIADEPAAEESDQDAKAQSEKADAAPAGMMQGERAAGMQAVKEPRRAYSATNEDRPLRALGAPLADLWHLTKWNKPLAWDERARPGQELRAATLVRACHSTYQLREVMTQFWHQHFHVNAASDDIRVQVSLPTYDRETIRPRCLGNFRDLLGAVARSTAMLAYLNNAGSRASPANENYARELFELHTLGRERYLNHLYNRWRDVPGAVDGKPEGYIDQDVYEAARAFTGWTIADGSWGGDEPLPDRGGSFLYHEAFHDNYQKRVLGAEFEPNQPPMADGERVLDLVAAHPGTARHICGKLCRALGEDDPPAELIAAAADAWTTHAEADDQIARVVRAIALHKAFGVGRRRVKRPFELAASLLRAIGGEVRVSNSWMWVLGNMGQGLYEWPTPAGPPLESRAWTGASAMIARWNLPEMVMAGWFDGARVRLVRQVPEGALSAQKIVEFWSERLLGAPLAEARRDVIARAIAGKGAIDEPPDRDEIGLVSCHQNAVQLIAAGPEFQVV